MQKINRLIREHTHTFGETYATITQNQDRRVCMRTVGIILLTVLRFAVMLFVGTFLFLVKLALGGR